MKKLVYFLFLLPSLVPAQNHNISVGNDKAKTFNLNVLPIGVGGFYFDDIDLQTREMSVDMNRNEKDPYCVEVRMTFNYYNAAWAPEGVTQQDIEDRVGDFWAELSGTPPNSDFNYPLSGQQITLDWTPIFSGTVDGKNDPDIWDVKYTLRNTYSTLPEVRRIRYNMEYRLKKQCDCSGDIN
tara:strand:+ start:2679 stop:3224 length:546 start_codon:yes stop_codon:yes gene_type:complete